ncbi:hypothetical protein SteCoe_37289 [Stentor coeruleus]|uniref:Peptidase A1 domain-containing protein n=1 Tax=Stentor coeruleus TaxID=5963 RepID=A0A1R2ANC8_9CILI|nr:hypothetical protein SteCoe_37289 [Stentor coeruleus]
MFAFLVIALLALQGDSKRISLAMKLKMARSVAKGRYSPLKRSLQETEITNSVYYFVGNFSIGTPSKEFRMYIDTGSSYSWVEKKDCEDCASFNVQYDPAESSTYKDMDYHVENSYIDGSGFSGDLAQDIIKIGEDFEALSYFVLSTSNTNFDYEKNNCDGLIGLGFKEASDGYPTCIDSLKSSGIIDERIFSLYLNDLESEADENMEAYPPSNLEIGGYDLDKYSESGEVLVKIPVTIDKYWGTDLIDVYYEGAKIGSQKDIIFDCGTSLIYASSNDYKEIVDYMLNTSDQDCETDNDGTLLCSCSDIESMPSLSFKYNGVELMLESSATWVKYSNSRCFLNLYDSKDTHWVLGGTFLKKYYTIYDMENKEISFYPAVQASLKLKESQGLYLALSLAVLAFSF